MNRHHHEPAELDDFETQLKSLAPCPPLAATARVDTPDDLKQVAAGRRWWSAEAGSPRAFYRTVGLSAAVGALFGAACTLLIVNWSGAVAPHPAPSVAVATGEVPPSKVSLDVVSKNNTPPDNVAAPTEHNQESAVAVETGSKRAHAELQPQVTSVRRGMSDEYPIDWLDELRRLKPGTLGVGSRLVNLQSARLRAATKESTFEPPALSGDESPEAMEKTSADGSRDDLGSAPLPQRQWMRQMLTSPNEFY